MEQQQNNNKTTTKQQQTYENGKIYKITAGDEIYIGSTTQKYISQRFSHHVSSYNSFKKNKKGNYCSSYYLFDKYEVSKCSCELIEYFPCKNKRELLIREYYYINTLDCVNNIKKSHNNHINPESQSTKEKCASCYNLLPAEFFQKEEKMLKTCEGCRNKSSEMYKNKKQEPQTPCRFIDHRIKFKRLNDQFMTRTAFPRHKFETKYVMTDIRDCHRPSCEVVFTNR